MRPAIDVRAVSPPGMAVLEPGTQDVLTIGVLRSALEIRSARPVTVRSAGGSVVQLEDGDSLEIAPLPKPDENAAARPT